MIRLILPLMLLGTTPVLSAPADDLGRDSVSPNAVAAAAWFCRHIAKDWKYIEWQRGPGWFRIECSDGSIIRITRRTAAMMAAKGE